MWRLIEMLRQRPQRKWSQVDLVTCVGCGTRAPANAMRAVADSDSREVQWLQCPDCGTQNQVIRVMNVMIPKATA